MLNKQRWWWNGFPPLTMVSLDAKKEERSEKFKNLVHIRMGHYLEQAVRQKGP